MVAMLKMCWWSTLSLVAVTARKRAMHSSHVMSASRKHAPTTLGVPEKSMVLPRGDNQRAYVEALGEPKTSVVFGTGPAGCGKTLFACYAALRALQNQEVEKIILTRPVVSVEEELGFLPGNIQRKMDPWLQPLFDIFLEQYSQRELERMIAQGQVEISPLGFMRGRTFKRCFVIADEMQNSSPGQMLMLLTRVGEESKLVVTGDPRQSDLKPPSGNGLSDFLNRYQCAPPRNESRVAWVKMTADDVARSAVVSEILQVYEQTLPETVNRGTTAIKSRASDAALIPASHSSEHFGL